MTTGKGTGGLAVVGLGQACLDLLGRVPRYPAVDEKIEVVENPILTHVWDHSSTTMNFWICDETGLDAP